MNQQEIASYLNNNFHKQVSVSTISRTLKKMYQAKYCSYQEESTGRRIRKYYAHGSIKDLSIKRFRYSIRESHTLMQELEKIEQDMLNENPPGSEQLLKTIIDLRKMYAILNEIFEDFESALIEKLETL
ncbi:MAG: hypothetical protein ACFFE8_02530 [Candidatus Heimdallarchaeota archaeon]